jgi:hypothetical protein
MAIAPVVIEFLAKGMPQVEAAFQSIQAAAIKAGKAQEVAAEKSSKARIKASKAASLAELGDVELTAKEKIAAMKRSDKAIETAHVNAGKIAAARIKAEDKLESNVLKGKEKRELASIVSQRAANASFAAWRIKKAEEVAKAVKAAADKEYQALRSRIADTKRAEAELTKYQVGEQKRRSDDKKAADKQAAKHQTAIEKQQQLQHQQDASRNKVTGRVVGAIVGAGARGVMSGFQRSGNIAMGLANTAAGFGGGFSIADSVQKTMDIDTAARRLANSTKDSDKLGVEQIKNTARAASIATGTDASELIGASKAYVAKSADSKGALEHMQLFGKIAKGTDTKIEDIANAAGILRVQNKNLSGSDMEQMLLDIIAQGKSGSVEISDLAKVAGKITKTSSSYAGKQTDTQRQLLGISQIGIATSGSPEEAATSLTNVSADALKHSDKVEKLLGRKFLNEKGQIDSSPEEFIADVMDAAKGNTQTLFKSGFNNRSVKMFQALSETYNNPEGGLDGREAVLAKMRDVTESSYTKDQLDRDVKSMLDSPTEKFAASLRQLQVAAGDRLLPVFIDMIPVLERIIPQFANFSATAIPAFGQFMETVSKLADKFQWLIGDVAAHPIGALIAYEVTQSFINAGLASVIRGLFAGGIPAPGVTPGVPGPGVIPGAPGAVGAPGATAALSPAAGLLAGVGMAAQGALFSNLYSGVRGAQQAGENEANVVSKMTPEDAAKEIERAQLASGGGRTATAWGDIATRGATALVNPLAAAGGLGVDALVEALGGKSQMSNSLTAIQGDSMLDALNRIADNTSPFGGNSGSGGKGRAESIFNR